MIKQIGEIKNKCIYNDKNAYLSIPHLVMSTRCMNLCREKKNVEKMTKMRQRKILFEQSSKSQMNNINNKNTLGQPYWNKAKLYISNPPGPIYFRFLRLM